MDTSFRQFAVCPHEHQSGNREVKSLGGPEIDQQLKLGRLLDWEVSRLGTLQNFYRRVSASGIA